MPLKLYLEDPYQRVLDAEVVASAGGRCALSRTAVYPGGGGQPADRGRLFAAAEALPVGEVSEDDAGEVWHRVGRDLEAGTALRGEISPLALTTRCHGTPLFAGRAWRA